MPGKPKNEDLLKLDDVGKLLLELVGVTRTRSTIYSWVKKGRTDYVGSIVKLQTTRRLGRLYTTRQWVLNFIKAIG